MSGTGGSGVCIKPKPEERSGSERPSESASAVEAAVDLPAAPLRGHTLAGDEVVQHDGRRRVERDVRSVHVARIEERRTLVTDEEVPLVVRAVDVVRVLVHAPARVQGTGEDDTVRGAHLIRRLESREALDHVQDLDATDQPVRLTATSDLEDVVRATDEDVDDRQLVFRERDSRARAERPRHAVRLSERVDVLHDRTIDLEPQLLSESNDQFGLRRHTVETSQVLRRLKAVAGSQLERLGNDRRARELEVDLRDVLVRLVVVLVVGRDSRTWYGSEGDVDRTRVVVDSVVARSEIADEVALSVIRSDERTVSDAEGAWEHWRVRQSRRDIRHATSTDLLTLDVRGRVEVVTWVTGEAGEDRGSRLDTALVAAIEQIEEEDQTDRAVHRLDRDQVLTDERREDRSNEREREAIEVADILGTDSLVHLGEILLCVLQNESGEWRIGATQSLAVVSPLRLGEHFAPSLDLLQEILWILHLKGSPLSVGCQG